MPRTEGVLNAAWIGNDRVVVGGFIGPTFRASILVFSDGRWSTADVPDAPGQVTGIAAFDDRLIAVGNGLPDSRTGFIWTSPDGQVWQAIETIADAALYDVATARGAVIAAGALHDEEMTATAAVWSSTDGTSWQRAKVASAAKATIGSVAATAAGYVAIGDRPLGQPRPLWTATAPSAWAAVKNDLSDQLLPIDIVEWNDTLAIAGASGKSGDQHPFVALSRDGRQWDRTNLSAAEGYASAAAVANDRLVVAGVDADRLTLWTLRDGAWSAEVIEPSGASISALAWDADRGLLAVGSRAGDHATWLLDAP